MQTSRGLKLGILNGHTQGIHGLVGLSFVLQYIHEQRMRSGQRLELLLQDMQILIVDILHKHLAALTDHEDILEGDCDGRRNFIAGALSTLQKYLTDVFFNDVGEISAVGKSKRSEGFLSHADMEKMYLEFNLWPGPAAKKKIMVTIFRPVPRLAFTSCYNTLGQSLQDNDCPGYNLQRYQDQPRYRQSHAESDAHNFQDP